MLHRFYTYLLMFSLSISAFMPTQSKSASNWTGVVLAGSVITSLGIWIYSKNQTNNALSKELNYLKSDQEELKKSERLLLNTQQTIDAINELYNEELALINSPILLLERLLKPQKNSIDQISQEIEKYSTAIDEYSKQLAIQIIGWQTKANRKHLIIPAQQALKIAQDLCTSMYKLKYIVDSNKAFFALNEYVFHQINQTYAKEYTIIKSGYNYSQQLHNHIIIAHSSTAYQFPYLSYLSILENTLNEAKILLNQSNRSNIQVTTPLYVLVKNQAEELINILEIVRENVVISSFYNKEKENKPIFEREQKLTEILIREKEARIEEERRKNEILLHNEHNKAQELTNQRKEQDLHDKQIQLEFKRIKDSDTIKEALKKNNKSWETKIEALQKERVSKIKELELQLDTLNNNNKQENKLRTENKNLKDVIGKAHNTIDQLDSLLDNPPFNPEGLDNFSDYLKQLHKLNNALSHILK